MADLAQNPPPAPPPTYSITELAAELQKLKKAKIWWWQRDDILKARMSAFIMAFILLSIVLTIYLSLLLTNHLTVREIHLVVIMLLILVSLFFIHSLFHLVTAAIGPQSSCESPSNLHMDIESQPQSQSRPRNPNRNTITVTFTHGPGGYAIPAAPIPIAYAAIDGDIDVDGGDKSPAIVTAAPPPAYGLWRSSVRVNPDQFYWVRRGSDDAASSSVVEMGERSPPLPPLPLPLPPPPPLPLQSTIVEPTGGVSMPVPPARAVYRLPSYSSEDGVEYVLGRPRTAVMASSVTSTTVREGNEDATQGAAVDESTAGG